MRLVLFQCTDGTPIYVNPENVCDVSLTRIGDRSMTTIYTQEDKNGFIVLGDLADTVAKLLGSPNSDAQRAELAALDLGAKP